MNAMKHNYMIQKKNTRSMKNDNSYYGIGLEAKLKILCWTLSVMVFQLPKTPCGDKGSC